MRIKTTNTLLADYTAVLAISPRLKLFTKEGNNFNFRCPICGDSKKNPYKKRGYIVKSKIEYYVNCFNCDYSSSLGWFIKKYFSDYYSEYIKNVAKNKLQPNHSKKKSKNIPSIAEDLLHKLKKEKVCASIEESFSYNTELLTRFTDLNENHPARIYVTNRGILNNDIWYCKNFIPYLRRLDVNKKYTKFYSSDWLIEQNSIPRIIIPFWNENGASLVQQARTFGGNNLRYITLKKIEDSPKIWGMNDIDLSKLVYILEGPIDAMMISNSIAMAGASISDIPSCDHVYVYDWEPRNYQIMKIFKKCINQGNKIFIPDANWNYKDLNEAFIDGISKDEIKKYINKRIFQGLRAQIEIKKQGI